MARQTDVTQSNGSQVSSEDAFTYVTHINNKAKRKNRKGRAQVEATADEKLARRKEIVEQRKRELSQDTRLIALLDNLFPHIPSHPSSSPPEEQSTRSETNALQSALLLGLGSVKDARPAQVQLAFFLLVCARLRIVDMHAYDPIWTEEDREVLQAFNVIPLADNKRGSHSLHSATFVFMPHCTRGLYENLLRANWSHLGLRRLLLCCNDLARYGEQMRRDGDDAAAAATSSSCIERAIAFLHVYPLPSIDSLNDSAFQTFYPLPVLNQVTLSTLPLEDNSTFWSTSSLDEQCSPQDVELV